MSKWAVGFGGGGGGGGEVSGVIIMLCEYSF